MVATLTRSSAWNTSHWPRTWCRRRWRGHYDLAVLRRAGKSLRLDHADFAQIALDVARRVSKWHYGGGPAYEAKLALGIEGETSDRNLLHLVE
jgi:hypothetical protein